jgi:hypothetical protein
VTSTRGPAPDAQAAQETRARAACTCHRQAQELRGGEPGSGAQCRTSPTQGAEQPGGKLAPADTGAREGDVSLQISASRATFASVHDQIANLFMNCRYHTDAGQKRTLRTQAFEAWESVTGAPLLERLAA